MSPRKWIAASLLGMLSTSAMAQERVVVENGVTYRETVQTNTYPTWEQKWEEQPVVREQVTIENQRTARTVFRPVIEYRWQPVLRNRFNLLAHPYWSYELIPVTRWETQNETVEVPVARRQYVADNSQTVKVLVPTQRLVEEKVIRRVVIDGKGEAASVARRNSIGGTSLKDDPPR